MFLYYFISRLKAVSWKLTWEDVMEYLIKRKTGGQQGNQNARKHGLYSKVLSADQKRKFKLAVQVDGIDEEIAIIRVKFSTLIAQESANQALINQTVKTLGRLYEIKTGRGQDLAQIKAAMTAVIEEFIIPVPPLINTGSPGLPELNTEGRK